MQINQVNFSYAPLEDRLLMRVNTTDSAEFRFWLTRAVVIKMVSGLWQSEQLIAPPQLPPIINPSARQAIQQFNREASIAESDFSTQFAPSTTYPLGENPALVTKLDIRTQGNQASLGFTLATGQTVTIDFQPQLVTGVNKLLQEILKGVDWNLPGTAAPRPAIMLSGSDTLH